MRENNDLELLLDAALKTYADSAASPDLEERILARIQTRMAAEPAIATRRRWLPWVIALPVAAGLLLLAVLMSVAPRPQPNRVALVPSTPSTPAAAPSVTPRSATAHRVKTRAPLHSAKAADLAKSIVPQPKLDVFPTPQPLSAEELALALVATQAPMPLRNALVEAQKQDDVPLRIAATHIPPLDSPDQGQP
jgi:hypothetical protein